MKGNGSFAHGFVADGELVPVPEEQVAAVVRLVARMVPAEDQPSIAAMLGVAA